jgi:hypothetical protein
LRQFIEPTAPQPAPKWRNPPQHAAAAGAGKRSAGRHRAELDEWKTAIYTAHTLGNEEHGAPLHGQQSQADEANQRQDHRDQAQGEGQVDGTAHRNLHQFRSP